MLPAAPRRSRQAVEHFSVHPRARSRCTNRLHGGLRWGRRPALTGADMGFELRERSSGNGAGEENRTPVASLEDWTSQRADQRRYGSLVASRYSLGIGRTSPPRSAPSALDGARQGDVDGRAGGSDRVRAERESRGSGVEQPTTGRPAAPHQTPSSSSAWGNGSFATSAACRTTSSITESHCRIW